MPNWQGITIPPQGAFNRSLNWRSRLPTSSGMFLRANSHLASPPDGTRATLCHPTGPNSVRSWQRSDRTGANPYPRNADRGLPRYCRAIWTVWPVCAERRIRQGSVMTTEYMTDYEVSRILGVVGCAGSAEPTGPVRADGNDVQSEPGRMKCVKALRNGALGGSGPGGCHAPPERPCDSDLRNPALPGREWPGSRMISGAFQWVVTGGKSARPCCRRIALSASSSSPW